MATKAETTDVAGMVRDAVDFHLECEQDSVREDEEADTTWHRAAVGEPGSDLASFLLFTGDGRAFRISVERSEDDDTEPAEDYRGP